MPALREEAVPRLTVVDPATVVTTHLTEMVKDNMAELLSYAETQKLLDELPPEHQKLVDELVPAQITVAGVQRVLQTLLAERVSIRDLPAISKASPRPAASRQAPLLITEHVRDPPGPPDLHRLTAEGGFAAGLTLSPAWEQAFADAIVGQGDERQLAMAPTELQRFRPGAARDARKSCDAGEMPVLLTTPAIRPFVRSVVERFRPATIVMSQNEIHPKARFRALGQV